MRVALYPCCNFDFDAPAQLLKPYVDKIIFCDVNRKVYRKYKEWVRESSNPTDISTEFECLDVRTLLTTCSRLSVFFYRRDSAGEGGSGIPVFGDEFLSLLMGKFDDYGYIISDGSNSIGNLFRQMISAEGLKRFGFEFQLAVPQTLRETFELYVIKVVRLART